MKKRLQAWGNSKVIPIACCFVFNEVGQLLLLQRHIEDLGGGQWGTPGGRLELGETPKVAVVRELQEETGLSIHSVRELGRHKLRMPHGTVEMTSFIAMLPGNPSVVLDPEEHHAFAWFDVDDLLHAEKILYGIPTILRDFDLLRGDFVDPTLVDGSKAMLLERV